MLCVFASATGISVEQVTQDWSRTNYSSARAALMETWKTLMRRRHQFTTNTATPMYGGLAAGGDGARRAAAARRRARVRGGAAAYSRCEVARPGARLGRSDEGAAGHVLRMEAGISTLESEAQSRAWTGKRSLTSARSSRGLRGARRAAAEVGCHPGRRR
jgi:hypothetical protein